MLISALRNCLVAGTSYMCHSQFFSKKNLWNEKVAKEPKSSQMKFLEPSASQKSQISCFWLQKIQSCNPVAAMACKVVLLCYRCYVKLPLLNFLWRHRSNIHVLCFLGRFEKDVLYAGPALSRCSCIGTRGSGAPRHSVQVDVHFCQIHLALENSVETPYKFHC